METSQKHLGLFLDQKLNFLKHFYKSFVRPHLDYGDTLYDKRNNNKIESLQYHIALAITCAIRGSSKENLY